MNGTTVEQKEAWERALEFWAQKKNGKCYRKLTEAEREEVRKFVTLPVMSVSWYSGTANKGW